MEKSFQRTGTSYRSRIHLIPGPFLVTSETGGFPVGEDKMEWLVQEIRRVLEDESLDDFGCIDKILSAYAEAGVPVHYRHDFG